MKRLDIEWKMQPIANFDLSTKSFKRYLENNGFRESTVEGYIGNAHRYLKFCGTERPSANDILRFQASLHDSKLSRSTLNQYGYAIKAYHKMLGEKVAFPRINPDNCIPYYFSSSEVQRIFSVCSNLKHYTMLTTLFYGALRASELCALDDQDVNLESLTIRVRHGKGGKDGIVCINNDCARVLKQYIVARPPLEIDKRRPLFYTDYGQRWKRTDLHRMFTTYKKRACVEKKGGLHVFSRHTPATIMIANGCDIRIVKDVLRHEDIRTTLRYAHVSDKTKRERYEQCLVL
jgi:integrase/recombinase XerD